MGRWLLRVTLAGIMVSAAATAAGSVAVHTGAHDPTDEAWSVVGDPNGATGSPVAGDADFPAVYAWQINTSASGRLAYGRSGPAVGDSWSLDVRVRLMSVAVPPGTGQYVDVANGSRRFLVVFGTDSDGGTIVGRVVDSGVDPLLVTVPPAQVGRTDYVRVRIAYDHSTELASIWVNDELVSTDFAGVPAGFSRINFGDGNSDEGAPMRWASVRYRSGALACNDGIDNDGDGALDFPADADCAAAADDSENAFCEIGTDLDGDGLCEQVFAAHADDLPPSDGGWLASVGVGQIRGPEAADLGAGNCPDPCPYWLVEDPSTASGSIGTYRAGPYPYDAPGGWEYRALVRVQPLVDGAAESPTFAKSLYARFPNAGGNQEYALQFGVTAEGILQIAAPSDALGLQVFDVGDSYQFHDVQLVYNPAEGNADVLVDGELLIPDFDGRDLPGVNDFAVHWGSGSSAGTGRTHWKRVVLELAPDSDDDGLSNAEELATTGTDPFRGDSDDDGLADGDEVARGTNPLLADSDGDGLRDGFEVAGGLDPLSPDDAAGDLDGDGLDNAAEQEAGTRPDLADTDGDGLSDGYELNDSQSDPLLADTDGDGLNDGEEAGDYLSSPLLADTDRDGLDDGSEIAAGTDPRQPDSDGDALFDGVENALGTNPLLADSDGDGLRDGFEVEYGFDALTAGEAAQDADGDGLSNLAEQDAGSSPLAVDSDGDGLDDYDEVVSFGTDPMNDDGDGDGLTDSYELAVGFDPTTAGDGVADTDNDGLTNLDEQQQGTDPLNPDSDGDGFLDGEEVHIFGSEPELENTASLPVVGRTRLSFEARDQPLFDSLPDPKFIDLVPLFAETAAGTVNQGRIETISRPIPLAAAQAAWDEAVATCDAFSRTFTTPSACTNLTVSPTPSECINGGRVNFNSRSVSCCAFAGIPVLSDSISNGCGFPNSAQSFTIDDVNDLPGGPYISPTFIDVGPGAGPRPSGSNPPPPRDYQVGAQIQQSTAISGGFTFTPGLSSADPGTLDLYYDTDASAAIDRSVVAPGEVFRMSLAHRPLPFNGLRFDGETGSCVTSRGVRGGSCMSSDWPDFDASITLDVNINVSASADIYTIDTRTGDQIVESMTVLDQNLGRSYELGGFGFAIGDEISFRLLNDVPTVPEFVQQEIRISNDDIFGLIDPGSKLPIPIDIPFGCFLKRISEALCITLGIPPESGISTNLMTLQVQIPELNSPVRAPDPFNPLDDGFFGGAPRQFSLDTVVPRRHFIDDMGRLVNSVPNKFRPTLNFSGFDGSAESFIDTFILANTDLSSDVIRLELDLDGIVCINTLACLGASSGIPVLAPITFDALDVDAVLWTGWDQTLTFDPGLTATLRFSTAVEVRLPDSPDWQSVAADSPLTLPISAEEAGLTTLEVRQPEGGVEVAVSYSFADNSFTNDTALAAKIGAEFGVLEASIGGVIGALYQSLLGIPWQFSALKFIAEAPPIPLDVLSSSIPLVGERMTFPGPVLRVADAGSDADGDGLVDSADTRGCLSDGDADSDDDGLPDGLEDLNRNGVVDAGETDPCLADSDGDGVQDGAERGLVTPHPDTDLDVFEPSTRPLWRTDPLAEDTDGDGLSDGFELENGLNPLDIDDCPSWICGGRGWLPVLGSEERRR